MESQKTASSIGTPSAELEIDVPLIADLLAAQHPDLKHLPIHLMDAGWDNVMFRLGDQLAVRLPRRKMAAALLEHEQTWLPQLADRLPISVPKPYRCGQPALGYPWCWSVLPWLPGVCADQQEPDANQAQRFALFLRSLHIPAPSNAPRNPFRGVRLHQRAALVAERMQRLETTTNLITPVVKRAWNQALNAPIDVQPTWLHGDLHPRNILVENGLITGIIDWGDITCGDRATDLAAIWMLFSTQTVRQQAIAAYGSVSPTTLQRAQGWAIFFGTVLLETGLLDNPRNAAIGERILQRIAEDNTLVPRGASKHADSDP